MIRVSKASGAAATSPSQSSPSFTTFAPVTRNGSLTCGGLWLDEGEFSRIHQEVKGAKVAPPGRVAAMVQAAAQVRA